jgi:hypothetical protein
MVAIAEVEKIFQPRGFDQGTRVALVGQNGFADAEVVGILFVVAGANQVSGVAFAEEFGNRPESEDGSVVEMRRDQGQHFAGMRIALDGVFDGDAGGSGDVRLRGERRRAGKTCGDGLAEEIAAVHVKSLFRESL